MNNKNFKNVNFNIINSPTLTVYKSQFTSLLSILVRISGYIIFIYGFYLIFFNYNYFFTINILHISYFYIYTLLINNFFSYIFIFLILIFIWYHFIFSFRYMISINIWSEQNFFKLLNLDKFYNYVYGFILIFIFLIILHSFLL